MPNLRKKRSAVPAESQQGEEVRKQQKKSEEEGISEFQQEQPFLPTISDLAQHEVQEKIQTLKLNLARCIELKNYKSLIRVLKKEFSEILRLDARAKTKQTFLDLLGILCSYISMSQVATNFFLQKALCDFLEELLIHSSEFVENNVLDVIFALINTVDSKGIKENLLAIIVKQSKKNLVNCAQSIRDNSENEDINQLCPRIKFKFLKLLYQILCLRVPEQELQSAQRNASSGGLNKRSIKSFSSQLISEMVRWLQQEPQIAPKVLQFLLSIETKQDTIMKLCLLHSIDLNEQAQLCFLDYLKSLFLKNPNSQQEIALRAFQYLNNCTRSLSYKVRLRASQVLQHFPYFDDALLLRTIKLEQFQDYGKQLNTTTPSKKGESEKFSISHGFGAIVHLLEDEFHEVRWSAIEVIQNFGSQCESFGREARDILFYMLNDENDSVRIKAIQTIRLVLAQEPKDTASGQSEKLVVLKTEELDNLLFNVKEKVPRLRIVIYKLLGKVWLENVKQLNMILDMIVRNVEEFGDDLYILEMCQRIGEHNSQLVRANICPILQIADVLYVQEPHWKDKFHISRVVMISNAFKDRDELAQKSEELFPSYFMKQYDMMQDLMPAFFHSLSPSTRTNTQSAEKSPKEHLRDMIVSSLCNWNSNAQTLKVLGKNATTRISSLGGEKDGCFLFFAKFSKAAAALKEVSSSLLKKKGGIGFDISSNNINTSTFQLMKVFKKLHSIQKAFVLDDYYQKLSQGLLFIALMHLPILHSQTYSTQFESMKFCKALSLVQDVIREAQKQGFISNSQAPNTEMQCFDDAIKIIGETLAQPHRLSEKSTRNSIFSRYRTFLEKIPYKLIFGNKNSSVATDKKVETDVLQRESRIIVPKDNPTIEVKSKYMASMPFVAEIKNFATTEERKNLFLLMQYSNGQSESFNLLEEDLIYLGESTYVVNTNVFLQKISWTAESSAVISLNFQSPLSFFSLNSLDEVIQAVPSSNQQMLLSQMFSSTIATSSQFTLLIKSRVA